MVFKIETCWLGGDNFAFRATGSDGHRFLMGRDGPSLNSRGWDRKAASEMLDILESEGYVRKNIRFKILC